MFLLWTGFNLGRERNIDGRTGVYRKGQTVDKWDETVRGRLTSGEAVCEGRFATLD